MLFFIFQPGFFVLGVFLVGDGDGSEVWADALDAGVDHFVVDGAGIDGTSDAGGWVGGDAGTAGEQEAEGGDGRAIGAGLR